MDKVPVISEDLQLHSRSGYRKICCCPLAFGHIADILYLPVKFLANSVTLQRHIYLSSRLLFKQEPDEQFLFSLKSCSYGKLHLTDIE